MIARNDGDPVDTSISRMKAGRIPRHVLLLRLLDRDPPPLLCFRLPNLLIDILVAKNAEQEVVPVSVHGVVFIELRLSGCRSAAGEKKQHQCDGKHFFHFFLHSLIRVPATPPGTSRLTSSGTDNASRYGPTFTHRYFIREAAFHVKEFFPAVRHLSKRAIPEYRAGEGVTAVAIVALPKETANEYRQVSVKGYAPLSKRGN